MGKKRKIDTSSKYSGKGERKPSSGMSHALNNKLSSESKKRMNDAIKMEKIRRYANDHCITEAQAMIHFMD